jgi:hypothetical protein
VAEQRAIGHQPAEGIPLAVRVVDGRVLALIDAQVALLLRDGESDQQFALGINPPRPLAAAIAPDARRIALIDAVAHLCDRSGPVRELDDFPRGRPLH